MRAKEDDQKLVRQICKGDIASFRLLVERYKKKVYYLAYDMTGDHHDAEDISQEVFIKVFRFIKNFRQDAKLSSWLYQVTVNTCIDSQRKKKAKPQVLLESSQIESMHQAASRENTGLSEPERIAVSGLLQERIRRMLSRVSPRERSVFVMRYYNDLKIGEIAGILKVSVNTVKSLLSRAKKKLKKELSLYRDQPGLETFYE
jgi:RNA polymerase sigma-70 factor (ECF subfamily)